MWKENSFQDLSLKGIYSSQLDDLINDFYNPVLELAVQYDRITGFFSPKVLAAASRGFSRLIKNGGRVRLITSVEVDAEIFDLVSADNFSLSNISGLENWDVESIENQLTKDYLGVFGYLLEKKKIDIKVAVVQKDHGIFHQKTGIVADRQGNKISFSGSNNETAYGWLYNIEKFYVFNNWSAYSSSYFQSDCDEFENLWNGNDSRVKMVEIDSASRESLIKKTKSSEDINIITKRISGLESPGGQKKSGSQLRDYQIEAIEHWESHGYKSILEMATGTGKTFTAASALRKFLSDKGYLRAVIVVPLTTLTMQWEGCLKSIIDDCLIINTSNTNNWKNKLFQLGNLRILGNSNNFIVITTYSLFNKGSFKEDISKIADNLILVADEMHNLVTEKGLESAASDVYTYRLGLSATPNRLWRPEDSKMLEGLFGDNRFVFSIKDAIEQERLVPYYYHPIEVPLTESEYEEYVKISRQIGKMIAGNEGLIDEDDVDDSDLKMKLMRRSRIKKNAINKSNALKDELSKLKEQEDVTHSLIYVENEKYLSDIQKMLTDINLVSSKIVGETTLEDRLKIIDSLRTGSIDAIIAIKCLDEGVDIPSAKRAFILSNNTDPREYVQRLGRVLRLDPESNKDHADVYDFIVTPPDGVLYEDERESQIADNMLRNEMIRANFFANYSINEAEVKQLLFKIADECGFVYRPEELYYNNNINNDNDKGE